MQVDGRISNFRLSEKVGLTAPPVLRRVRTLERIGAIKGYHAQLDSTMLGFPVSAFVSVGLKSQNGADIAAFEDIVRGWRNVREVYVVQGEFDFLMKCVARDLPEFQDFVTTHLMTLPNIRNVRSTVIIGTQKKAAFPIP